MTEFIKKVIVLDEVATGFGIDGKKASGVVKAQKNGSKAVVAIYVANFCKSRADFLECVLLRFFVKMFNADFSTFFDFFGSLGNPTNPIEDF